MATGRFIALGCLAGLVSVAALACAGDSGTTLTLRADTDSLPAGTEVGTAIQDAVVTLEQRVARFGSSEADVTVDGDQLTITVSGMDEEVARRLLVPQGVLDFRRPLISENGLVVCTDGSGEEFAISPLRVNPDSATLNPARCFGDSQLGDPQWESTPTILVRTQERSLADLIEPAGWQVRDRTTLAVQFDPDGTALLQDITAALVGYPLGIFVDEELIGAPRIQRAITNGNPVISGFDELEARIRQAQLNAGPLPFTFTEVGEAD